MKTKFDKKSCELKMKFYAPIVLRYSMVVVFLYFSLSQFFQPIQWVAYVPDSITQFVSAEKVVFLNACFELVLSVLLGLGIFTRTSALLLGLHLFGITLHVGFNPTGARDFGLTLATIAVALYGQDELCLENKWKKNKV
jgi:uncharacterized membrane protein YphA (DoxX/SURF4 family)